MFCADPPEQVVQLRGSSGGKHKLACRSGFKYGIGSPSSKKNIKQAPGPRAAFLGRDRLEADSKILQSDDKGCWVLTSCSNHAPSFGTASPDNCPHDDVVFFPYLKHVPDCRNPHLLQCLVAKTVKALLIHLSREFAGFVLHDVLLFISRLFSLFIALFNSLFIALFISLFIYGK